MTDFELTPLELKGAYLIKPKEFHDERGAFYKVYDPELLKKICSPQIFAEDFFTTSKKGVVRGLHYQTEPYALAKFIRCTKGQVFDVIVDMRTGSPTLGRWLSLTLSEENGLSLYLPRGFAHGFLSLSEGSVMTYKTDRVHSPEHERVLLWNDPKLGIAWPEMETYILSKKDLTGTPFSDAERL